MTSGVIYMTWGANAIQGADISMSTLWQYAPGTPVFVVGDAKAEEHYAHKHGVTFYRIDVDPFRGNGAHSFMAGRIKPLLAELSPFERSLYVDADTVFQSSPEPAFKLLDRWDFIVAETETRSLIDTVAGPSESRDTAEWLGTPHILYHNSGMLFWRKNKATSRLFDLWSEEWQRFQNWDEQVALLRALLRSDVLFLNVPFTWNCREGKKAFFLHHQFGTQIVRQYRGRSTASWGRWQQQAQQLVRVEVSPGRFVRCRAGEEEQVMKRFEQRWAQRRGRKTNAG